MQLTHLALSNFRNIEQVDFEPNRYFNVLYGENAQGKTNLLESICLLGSLKSFRLGRNEDLIRRGSDLAMIHGRSLNNRVADEMRLDITRDGKTARLNGKVVSQPDNYLNCLRPVVFSPEEVGLAKGGPTGRRRLLDRAVFQATPGFLASVQNFERQLRQRNRLIREKRPDAEIEPWTEGIIESGARIRQARRDYVAAIKSIFTTCYRQISGESEQAEIIYGSDNTDLAELQATYRTELQRQKDQERRYGMTLSGPHRDDIQFRLDARSVREFASQGQQRSFILALKTAQVIDLEKRYTEPPLLLLDDLLGELDRKRQAAFFRLLLGLKGQVFITTTDREPLSTSGIGDVSYFQVKDGLLHPRTD